ncbi:hypothetical protein [Microcoleus sp. B13-B6]|uniref:hypothetical protein n=1 Tax=Microcoleus sp. B13-B6 TaxID=2818652 RepID=UPI002FD59E58
MPVPQRKNQFSCGAYHCQKQARCLFHKERISFLVGRASCPSEKGLYGQNLGSS